MGHGAASWTLFGTWVIDGGVAVSFPRVGYSSTGSEGVCLDGSSPAETVTLWPLSYGMAFLRGPFLLGLHLHGCCQWKCQGAVSLMSFLNGWLWLPPLACSSPSARVVMLVASDELIPCHVTDSEFFSFRATILALHNMILSDRWLDFIFFSYSG